MLRASHRGGPGETSPVDATMPVSPVITLEGVSKHFQSTAALQNVSATIPLGQFVALIGRSGAGKTTLLHCLSRTTTVTAGSIRFGKIKMWDDPRITATNPSLRLPHDTIALVVRQDSSGTTYAFTHHLSAMSAQWRDHGPGVGRVIAWPGNAMVAPGNEGVAGRIKNSKGAIGYVEYGIAQRAGLTMAWLENKAGQFIQPHGESGLATLLNVDMPENLRVFFPDPDGKESYPIVTFSWLLLYKQYDDHLKAAALKQYVKWCLTEGQAFNESLGYVRLAPQVSAHTMAAVDRIR